MVTCKYNNKSAHCVFVAMWPLVNDLANSTKKFVQESAIVISRLEHNPVARPKIPGLRTSKFKL